MVMKRIRRHASLVFFCTALLLLAFGYGVVVGVYHVFPYRVLALALEGFLEVRRQAVRLGGGGGASTARLPWYYVRVTAPLRPPIYNTPQAYAGLNLVTRIAAGMELSASLMDLDGKQVHAWNVDWFRIWPDAEHLPAYVVPKSKPGCHLHGAVVLAGGDLVFNFEHLGLVRLDRDSKVVWRLPYRTHHSIHVHDNGNLWVCGQKGHTEADPRFPQCKPPFDEDTLLEVTPQGQIVQEWSVPDLLYRNGRAGLLHLGTAQPHPQVLNDLLHLNDVEPFPETLAEGFFGKGDVMVSLRNVNTVFVFNRQSGTIKYAATGLFVAQHDPDFVDGNRFSVLDNRVVTEHHGEQSRILMVSAVDNRTETVFEGSPERPFYTATMGKHQWLPNGNLLITESNLGRAFEIDPAGEIVWEYVHYIEVGVVGLVEEVQRLPLELRSVFR